MLATVLKRLKVWFRRRPKQPVKVFIVRRDRITLSLDEWRSTPSPVAQARELLATPLMKDMLLVLRQQHLGMICVPSNAPVEVAAAVQRQTEGYQMALNNLEALGVYAKPAEPLEATFEPPEVPEEEKE